MKFRPAYLESIFFFLIGVMLWLIRNSGLGPQILSFIYYSSLWSARTQIISQLLVAYSLLMCALGVLSFILTSRGLTLAARMVSGLKRMFLLFRAGGRGIAQSVGAMGGELVWPFAALGIAAGLSGYFLSQPMRGDEAYTFLNFVNKDFLALYDYQVPNNHVLHTLLVKLSTLLLGASLFSIRLPAFLMGLASILLVYCLARVLDPGKHAGVLAAVSMAVFPYLVLYSTNARGYTLVIVITLGVVFIGLSLLKKLSIGKVCLPAFVSAMGMLSMPSMFVGAAGVYCWLAALLYLNNHSIKEILLKFTLPFGVLSGIFSLILYTPVILVANGLKPIVANKFVESQSWPEFFANLIPQSLRTLDELSRDVPGVVLGIGLILLLTGLLRAARSRNWKILLFLPGLLVGAVAVMLIQRTVLYARTWIFALPFIFIVADHGFCALINYISPRFQVFAKTVLLIGGMIYAGYMMSANIISNYTDTSAFPEAQLAAQYLRPILTKNDGVHVTNTADWSFYFYCWYYHMPQPPAQAKPGVGRTFIIVKKSRYTIDDMTSRPVVKLLDFNDLALYQEVPR